MVEPTQIYAPLVSVQINETDQKETMLVVGLQDEEGTEYEVIFNDPLYYRGVVALMAQYDPFFMKADIMGLDHTKDEIEATNPHSSLNLDKLLEGDDNANNE